MFFPGAAVYMDKIAAGAGGRRRDRHRRVAGGERAPRRRGEGERAARRHGVVLERDRHEELIARAARGRRAGRPDPRRRRRAGDRGGARGDADGRPADGRRRHARGRDRRGGDQVPRRRAPGPALAARRRRAAEARRRGLRPRPRADDRRPRRRRGRLRRGDRRHRRRAAARRALHARRRGHRLDRDALALGHGPAHRGGARVREALRRDSAGAAADRSAPSTRPRSPSPARRLPVRAAPFIFARW